MSDLKHPLQSVFNMADEDIDIEKEYGMTQVTPSSNSEVPVDHKDEDDKLIEKRIDEVYDAAMTAFNDQTAFIQVIDPKFAARNAEVAANYLNIALQAAASRSRVKVDRKRANQAFVPYNNGGKTTGNLVVASREEILKMITGSDSDKKV